MIENKNELKFSVLMSVYKNDMAEYVDNSIESVYKNTVNPSEYIIIIDGPIPVDVYTILNKWQEKLGDVFKIHRLEANVGLAKALNYGLKMCSFEYIARMDSDDICFYDRFEKQIKFLANNGNISLLGGWYEQYDENMKILITDRKVPQFHDEIVKYAKIRTPFNHVTAMFKKKDVIAVGGYPENIKGRLEDWWLSLRLISKGYKLHNLPEYLMKVRGGKDFFKRRGGFEYLSWEYNNLFSLRKEDLIDNWSLIKNIVIKTAVRIAPKNLRKILYLLIRKV